MLLQSTRIESRIDFQAFIHKCAIQMKPSGRITERQNLYRSKPVHIPTLRKWVDVQRNRYLTGSTRLLADVLVVIPSQLLNYLHFCDSLLHVAGVLVHQVLCRWHCNDEWNHGEEGSHGVFDAWDGGIAA